MDANTLNRAHRTAERVETIRPDIEEELGRFEVAVDEDGLCVLSAESGAQFVAWLSGPEADARLNVEEFVETNALLVCNCCEANRADSRSPGGYCRACERAAQTGEPCWHEEVQP